MAEQPNGEVAVLKCHSRPPGQSVPREELVFSCESAAEPLSGMRWLSHDGDKWIDHEIAGGSGLKYDRVVPYDVDADGDLDMLCCEERDGLGIFWYENTLPPRGDGS